MLADPATGELGLVTQVPGRNGLMTSRVSGTVPPKADGDVPVLGADTDAVLRELLDLDVTQIAALRRDGVIGPRPLSPPRRITNDDQQS